MDGEAQVGRWRRSLQLRTLSMHGSFEPGYSFGVVPLEVNWARREDSRVDWRSYKEAGPNTMWIPLYTSAVGDNKVLVRTVSCFNFPVLCILCGAQYTATELETAWLHMPFVRTRKPAHHERKKHRCWSA